MKILIALSRFPYPLDKGDKLRSFYQMKSLNRRHELHVICLTQHSPTDKAYHLVAKYCHSLHLIPHPRRIILFNLVKGLCNSRPFQVNYFHSSRMRQKISSVLHQQSVDLCYVQQIRLIPNIPFVTRVTYFLDYMDAFSLRFQRFIQRAPWYQAPFLKEEKRRLKNYEQKVAPWFDGVSAISKYDADHLPTSTKNIHVIPNGVAPEYLEAYSTSTDKVYDIIFTGNLNYQPNIKACQLLIEEILPRLIDKMGSLKVCLAGSQPHSLIRSYQNHNITVTGYVESLIPYLQQSSLFVAPLFLGSGLQNKLLEAMAVGIPVITTPTGNRGVNATPDKHLITASNIREFVSAITSLLTDNAYQHQLAQRGHQFVKQHYTWSRTNKKLEDAFLQTLHP